LKRWRNKPLPLFGSRIDKPSLGWKPVGLSTRLFVFFMFLVVTMSVGIVGIFASSGFFSAKTEENRKAVEAELSQMAKKAARQYGEISGHALRLSRRLSENIERRLAGMGFAIDDLHTRPDLLEEILDAEYDALFFALERAQASGAFLVLNATASRRAQEARIFRAGFFFKNLEPGFQSMFSSILYLRGISKIGQKNDMVLDAQWAMEFDIEDASYYALPQKAAKENEAFLPRLYYWQPAMALKGTDYRGMLCSVPLADSKGYVFGVCGFEVSDMLFKLSFMPANNVYSNIFCVMAPMGRRTLNVSQALFSWRYIVESEPKPGQELEISGQKKKGFSTYVQDNGDVFVGLHEEVGLYAKDSPFASEKYAIALLIPKAKFDALVAADNRRLLSFLLLLLGVGAFFSFILSKLFTSPILKSFSAIRDAHERKSGSVPSKDALRVNIPEIDDLMEYIFSQAESAKTREIPKNGAENRRLFLEDMELLSPTEKNVLELYLEGRSAKYIAEALGLSVNTIKTHNRHIFIKLNVTSRNELLARAREMKGRKDQSSSTGV
jgi:DNA-binding CsgD family transcriptional regulator